MELIVFTFTIFATWKWGGLKNWQKYHSTMIYSSLGNLLYLLLYSNHYLWQVKPECLNHVNYEIFFTFLVLPLTVLIFLTKYPITIKDQILHNIKFIAFFFFFELLVRLFGRIAYNNGWNIWWSLIWDCMMFPMLALHYKKPLIAYIASTIAVIIMLILFPVSLK